MKNYSFDSVDINLCLKSGQDLLAQVKSCERCKRIPLPHYISYKRQNSVYCKTCYLELNLKMKHLVYPRDYEYKLLEKLILNCETQNCSKVFSIVSIQEFILHKESCKFVFTPKIHYCKRCNFSYTSDKLHDCFQEFKKSILKSKDNNFNMNEIFSYVDKIVSKLNSEMKDSLIELKEEIKDKDTKIEQLEKKLIEIQNKFELNQILNFELVDKLKSQENKKTLDIINIEEKLEFFKNKIDYLTYGNMSNYKEIENCFNLQNINISELRNSNNKLKQNEEKMLIAFQKLNLINKKKNMPIAKTFHSAEIKRREFTNNCTTLEGHTKGVSFTIQLSYNIIASGSGDNTIKIWDLNSNQCIKTLEGHSGSVWSLIKLEDDLFASSSQDKTIKIWDMKNYLCSKTLIGHSGCIRSLILLKDGRIVSGSDDKTIRIWDKNDNKCISILEGHTNFIRSLIQLNDGRLVSGSEDNSIKLWDVETLSNIHSFQGHVKGVYCVIQLKDGRLASASFDKTIKIWNLNSNNCIKTIEGHTDYVFSLIQLRDGRIVSSSGDKTIKIWDSETYYCIKSLEGHSNLIISLIEMTDGRIASSSFDKTIKLW